MYYLLSVLVGSIIAVMVAINGRLSAQCGVLAATVIIHLVGTVFAFVLLKLRKAKIGLNRAIPWWLLSGGAIGVITTVCNNAAFGKISMTSLIALALLGQMLASLTLDCFGWMGMLRRRFAVSQLAGLLLAMVGVGVMLADMEGAEIVAVLLALCVGVSIVLSRTVNADLSGHIGALQGSFVNHAVGLPITAAMLLLFGRGEPLFAGMQSTQEVIVYLGGTLGVVVVLLYNLTVPKISALYLTLLSFAGQVLTGVLLDVLAGQAYCAETFGGGLLVSAGVLINLLLGAKRKPT